MYNNSLKIKKSALYYAGGLLAISNVITYSMIPLVYLLGKNPTLTNTLIYMPILIMIMTSVRDKYSFIFVLSCIHVVLHGLGHIAYPLVDESDIGHNKSVEAWPDVLFHSMEAVLFCNILMKNSSVVFKMFSFAFIIANFLSILVAHSCWGKECHELCLWVMLLTTISGGSHHAMAALFQTTKEVCTYGSVIQIFSAIITYSISKFLTYDIMIIYARYRIYELYFIVPHYVGYFHSRYLITKTLPNYYKMNNITKILKIIGIYSHEITKNNLPHFTNYLNEIQKSD